MKQQVFLTLLPLVIAACTTGHCRKPTELPTPPVEEKVEEKPANPSVHIFVYKPDGSLQCESKKGQSLDQMKSQLKGLKVFSQVKKKDGLMHISVCGSPTGMSNVFEISAKDLPTAEKYGFKKWLF